MHTLQTLRTTPDTVATVANTACVDRLLAAIAAGNGIPADLYTPDAVVDATVPGWRYTVRGPAAIVADFARWFDAPSEFEELDRLLVADGEVVTYLLTWLENGVPHAAHHCHRLRLADDGRIASDRVFCGGRWGAGLLAQMAAACNAD